MANIVVYATTRVEGFHCWPDAPDWCSFLRFKHRHMFHVKVITRVTHEDRDVEIIQLKREVTNYLKALGTPDPYGAIDFGTMSCETMATILLEEFNAAAVDVSEDGENGAIAQASQSIQLVKGD